MTTKFSSTPIRSLILASLAVLVCAAPALATYSLVWSDEFDGTGLNPANWSIDTGNGCPNLCGWGNNELQYYRSQNVAVTGGNLVLTARAESYGGASYTSGKVTSWSKQSFLYGRVEMRAKLPTGGGMWPAFWMMPQDNVYGGWALSGEIDIMEAANNMTSVGGTLHYGGAWPDNRSTGASYNMGGTSFAADYHVYAVEWEPDVIRWYVDDVLYSTKTSAQWYSNAAPGNPRAPFDQEFFIILNAAVGGNYTGCTDPGCITATFPQEYLIDYVRVYEEIANAAPVAVITAPANGTTATPGDIVINATATDADGTVTRVEFYNGGTYLGEDATAPYTFTWNAVGDGCYTIVAKAYDNLGGWGTDSVEITVGAGCGQASYVGGPHLLPTRIQAEDFDIGGEGVAYHDSDVGNNGGQYRPAENVDIETCQDVGGGFGVGWIGSGEWLEYTVTVPVTGDYPFEARVSSLMNGGIFHLELDGVDVTGDIIVPVTTGWQTWTTVTGTAALTAGTRTLRFVPTTVGFNLNYFEFLAGISAVDQDVPASGYALHPCYPNPFNPSTTVSFDLPERATVNLAIYDLAGQMVRTLVAAETVAAGRHEVVWNGRDTAGRAVAAGVYFCRLDAGGYSQTVRMALVK